MSSLDLSTSAATAAAHEIRREHEYRLIGLATDLNALMPAGITCNRFTAKFARFADANPLQPMLCVAGEIAHRFIEAGKFEDPDLKTGAAIYVISRVWATKRDQRVVFAPGLLDQLLAAKEARDQQVALHIAVNRLAKNAAENSFAAGLKVRITQVLDAANAHHLASITRPVEVGVPPMPMSLTSGFDGEFQ